MYKSAGISDRIVWENRSVGAPRVNGVVLKYCAVNLFVIPSYTLNFVF